MNKKWKKKWIVISSLVILYLMFFGYTMLPKDQDKLLISDVSRLTPIKVLQVEEVHKEEQLIKLIKKAQIENLKISISGAKHSQGGHIVYPGSIHLDMRSFNKILNLDEKNKTIRVQSGATWQDVQDYAYPYGLSVKVMQSSNIFTVGGSLSVNAHGRDIRFGPIIETVNSFRLLTADGNIIEVNRASHPELFSLVIGGYGLFGVILDVDLQLTEDALYEVEHKKMKYTEYASYFKQDVLGNPNVELQIARLSTAPSSFLKEMYSSEYHKIGVNSIKDLRNLPELKKEENIWRNKFIFGLSRRYDWGKELIWKIQKTVYSGDKKEQVIRNNAMRPEVRFLDYEDKKDTDILQEYFIPIDQFSSFIDEMREIVQKENVNLFNVTVRYVPKNEEAFLSYAQKENLAIVLLINQGLSKQEKEKARQWTQMLVDAAHKHGGTYYLAYQLYPTKEQLEQVYPKTSTFFTLKRKYDPQELFMNFFYEEYKDE